jgi:hypothetical protein
MQHKIDKKITGYRVVTDEPKPVEIPVKQPLKRPESLQGTTYKIKPPQAEDALYVTINDILDEDGTKKPFEIFINSKNMAHYQWVVAMTRLISGLWQSGNHVFIGTELKDVFDPSGGYFKRGGKFMPSLVAEIGYVIETHLGTKLSLDEAQIAYIETIKQNDMQLCTECNTKSLVRMDGCMTCTSCGFSKCG